MTYQPAWHLNGKPYEVQLEALRRSRGRDKYAYFLEQGLGKTALWLNDYIENYSDIDRVVILCPNTFKNDWASAPGEWGLDIKGWVWPYDVAERRKDRGRPRQYIFNFEAARSGAFDEISGLCDGACLVVDESSAIKNYKSDTARAVLDLAKRAKVVRLLNGTPMSQNVMDLFPQLKAVGQLDRVNPYAFRNHYAVMGGWMGKQVVGVRNEDELHRLLGSCSFRATKNEWADLPDKIDVPVRLEMTPKQRKHYEEMLRDFYTLVDGAEFTANMVISRLDKLRQITSGLIIDGDRWVPLETPRNNPKIKAALDIINGGDGKTIIVHFYTKTGNLIAEEIERNNLCPAYIRGGMTPAEVTEQKRRFNSDRDCRVLLAQITAASRAHTLIGGEGQDRAHKMFFHDHTFSYLDYQQMRDRIHRSTQDRTCLYYLPVMSSVDEAQLKALSKKEDMAALVVDAVKALAKQSLGS